MENDSFVTAVTDKKNIGKRREALYNGRDEEERVTGVGTPGLFLLSLSHR